jgi:hypothetical protein
MIKTGYKNNFISNSAIAFLTNKHSFLINWQKVLTQILQISQIYILAKSQSRKDYNL